MTAEGIGIIIAIVGCFVGLAGWLSGRDKKIANDSHWKGGIDAKLDNINSGVQGVCGDVKAMQSTLREHGEQLVKLDADVKSAHHRIDEIVR